MIELLLTAPRSGSGKTIMTCALLTALQKRGLSPCAFKCGPDYIDPMFHRAILGVESHNLDLFLSEPETVRQLYTTHLAGHDAAVCEGAMGFYDGVGGSTDRASAWQVADTLSLPALLVLRPRGASLSLAALVRGFLDFRKTSHLRGILLNDCSTMQYQNLASMLERETGLPVLGYLPHTPEAELESRHLGLYTAQEIENLSARMEALAHVAEQTVDFERLIKLCTTQRKALAARELVTSGKGRPVLAVAQDEAFCFSYAETLEALTQAGAELVPFSPLHDDCLPCGVCGIYLTGGYPEIYARGLSLNGSMRGAIAAAVKSGMPTVAECGGFLYLGQSLEDTDGKSWPMAGVLPGIGRETERLVRFGYTSLTEDEDSLLFRRGESIPAHEFHYWDSTENGTALAAKKPVSGRQWRCGFTDESLYAAFPHLYFAGRPQLASRFVKAAAEYQKRSV